MKLIANISDLVQWMTLKWELSGCAYGSVTEVQTRKLNAFLHQHSYSFAMLKGVRNCRLLPLKVVIYAIVQGLTHALWPIMQLFQSKKHNLLTFPQSLILFLSLTPLHQSSSLSFCCDPCWCYRAKFSSCLYSRRTIFSTNVRTHLRPDLLFGRYLWPCV